MRETIRRDYRLDASRIGAARVCGQIPETQGQLLWEPMHLLRKLRSPEPERCNRLSAIVKPDPRPLF